MNKVKLSLLPENLDKLKKLTDNPRYEWNEYKILSETKPDGFRFVELELQYKDLEILITHLLLI